MKNHPLKFYTLAILFSLQPFTTSYSENAASFTEMLTNGDVGLNFRYRYEYVDQDGIDREANASTLKSRLTWSSAAYKKFKAGIEIDNVTVIGDENYRTPTNGQTSYPVVADPGGTDINQAFVSFTGDDLTATAGRQRILHGNQRFVGGVGWRQNEQTFDAVRLQLPSPDKVSLDYAYIRDVNRIFGPDNSAVQPKRWESDSHILTAALAPAKGHKLGAFIYLLDFDNSPANSTSTYGIEYKGKAGPVSLTAALASQSDYADNPTDYSADYYMAELGLTTKVATFALGYEVLGSDDGDAGFRTPLATLHKFQGWADKFLSTPATGIEDAYLKVTGNIGPTKWALFYHDFSADKGSADYGSEINLVGTYPINKQLSAQLKYANYDADDFATDTEKLWFTLNLKY